MPSTGRFLLVPELTLSPLCRPQTDVIVNATSRKNWTAGPSSRAILRKAGSRMEKELQKASPGEHVVVTDAFLLKCKQVYHILWPVSSDHVEVRHDWEFLINQLTYVNLLCLPNCHWPNGMICPFVCVLFFLASTYVGACSFAMPGNGLSVAQLNLLSGNWHRDPRPWEKGCCPFHVKGGD